MNEIYEDIKYEDLTPDLQLLSEVCGIESIRSALKHFAGMSFYFPRISRLDKLIERTIKENPNSSRKELAQRLKVSEQFLKKHI
jgi:predicted HTH transcriptional regulator